MNHRNLRSRAIRLAHANPALRPHLLPLLGVRTADDKSFDEADKFEDDDGKTASLRSRAIRLAHANPALRPHLLPLLGVRTAAEDKVRVLNENGRAVWVSRQTLRDPKEKAKYKPLKEKGGDEGGSKTPHVDKKIMGEVFSKKEFGEDFDLEKDGVEAFTDTVDDTAPEYLSKNLTKLKKMSPEAKKKLSGVIGKSIDKLNSSIGSRMGDLYEDSSRIQTFMEARDPATAKSRWESMSKAVQSGDPAALSTMRDLAKREKNEDIKTGIEYTLKQGERAKTLRSIMKGLG